MSSSSTASPKCERVLRSQNRLKRSSNSVADPLGPVSFETVLEWCRGKKREPIIAVYLPPGSNQHQRDLVFRAFIHASSDTESHAPLDVVQVDAALLRLGHVTVSDDFSAAQPFQTRLSGPRSLWRFYGYIQARKQTVWHESVDPKLFLAVMPIADFHPIV
jgi:hypothetical protein